MRGSILNVRPNIPGMFHECYHAHWEDYPSMYDVSNKQYKDIEVKDCIWKAISAELKEPGNYT